MKKSVAWTNQELPLEFSTRILGTNKISPKEMSEHLLILGATGSGKTASVIEPVLESYWNYRSKDGLPYSMFVVDPKNELLSTLERLDAGQGRIVNVANCNERFNPFEGMDENYPTIADKFEFLFKSFGSGVEFEGNNSTFRDSSLALLRDICDFEVAIFEKLEVSFLKILAEAWTGNSDVSLADGLRLIAKDGVSALRKPLENLKITLNNSKESELKSLSVFDLIVGYVNTNCPELVCHLGRMNFFKYQKACNALSSERSKEDLRQLGYYVSYWDMLLNTLCSNQYKQSFDLDLIHDQNEKCSAPVKEIIDSGKVIVISPKSHNAKVEEMIVMNMKGIVFNYMLNRENMLAPMAYIADEFQNFISTDETTGEQNFLDRCRSYRVSCVLATQSIDSLNARVYKQNGVAGEKSLGSMLNNISNRVLLRTPDYLTSNYLRGWIGPSPNGSTRHVLDNFPLAKLKVGECYWLRSGEWSREQLKLSNKLKSEERDYEEGNQMQFFLS